MLTIRISIFMELVAKRAQQSSPLGKTKLCFDFFMSEQLKFCKNWSVGLQFFGYICLLKIVVGLHIFIGYPFELDPVTVSI